MTTAPDYTSKVPYYTFPDTLAEQEEALATNPLMQRLLAKRAARTPATRTAPSTTTSTPKPISTIPTDCASGRAATISSTKPIHRRTLASTGATP